MKHRSEGATALLGLAGFVVGAHVEVDDELWLHVETTAPVAGCPTCGSRGGGPRPPPGEGAGPAGGGPAGGAGVGEAVWRCPDPDCPKRTWTEASDALRQRAQLSERARAEICRRVGEDEDSVAETARAFGVGWHTAMAAVREPGWRV